MIYHKVEYKYQHILPDHLCFYFFSVNSYTSMRQWFVYYIFILLMMEIQRHILTRLSKI